MMCVVDRVETSDLVLGLFVCAMFDVPEGQKGDILLFAIYLN